MGFLGLRSVANGSLSRLMLSLLSSALFDSSYIYWNCALAIT